MTSTLITSITDPMGGTSSIPTSTASSTTSTAPVVSPSPLPQTSTKSTVATTLSSYTAPPSSSTPQTSSVPSSTIVTPSASPSDQGGDDTNSTTISLPASTTLVFPASQILFPGSNSSVTLFGAANKSMTSPTAIAGGVNASTTVPHDFTLYVPVTSGLSGNVAVPLLLEKVANAARDTANGTTTPGPDGDGGPVSARSTTNAGALAGAIVGSMLLVLLLCCGAFCLYRRRRKQNSSKIAAYSGTRLLDQKEALPPPQKESLSSAAYEMTGWQRHLPQEKDDESITTEFLSVVELVRSHVEGFYERKSRKPVGSSSRSHVLPPEIAREMRSGRDPLPLLEGVLLRLITHRIALGIPPDESFLPPELTIIPFLSGWSMDMTKKDQRNKAETIKGWREACSQWRRLTGYLRATAGREAVLSKEVDNRIQAAAVASTNNLATWQRADTETAKIVLNLRETLIRATDFGIMLATQPAAFYFDWVSEPGNAIRIRPALVKQGHESSRDLQGTQILVEASS